MIARRRSAREIFSRVFVYVRRYPWFAVGTMSCAILSTISGLAFPVLLRPLTDQLVAGTTREQIAWFAIGLLIACFLRDFFNFLRIQLNNRFEQSVIFDMRRELYDKLQRLSVRYFDQRATAT